VPKSPGQYRDAVRALRKAAFRIRVRVSTIVMYDGVRILPIPRAYFRSTHLQWWYCAHCRPYTGAIQEAARMSRERAEFKEESTHYDLLR